MRCWLYIILFVSYTDAKRCREKKHNSVATAVATATEVLWLQKLVTKAVAICMQKWRPKKKYAEEYVSNCPESEYSET